MRSDAFAAPFAVTEEIAGETVFDSCSALTTGQCSGALIDR
jgi:hypothetical protein